MVSDNTSTFMSATDELKQLFESVTLHDDSNKHGEEWRFIPCSAPWYGGYWECLIGLTKRASIWSWTCRTVQPTNTGCGNRSPPQQKTLTYITSDLDEPDPLTRGLLCGRMINTLPHPTISQDKITDDDNCT